MKIANRLIEAVVSVNIIGHTVRAALMQAVVNNSKVYVYVPLIKTGADVNHVASIFTTASMNTAQRDHIECLSTLQTAGAEVKTTSDANNGT